jgi:K+-transporting ATPase ATPase C chain
MRNEPSLDAAHQPTQSVFKGLGRPVLVSAVFFMAVTGLAYPLATTGVANLIFPDQAKGSLIVRDGKTVGSRQIGQHFTSAEYFHPRPSMTSGPDPRDPSKTVDQPYNAGASAASNQAVISKKLLTTVAERVAAYRQENGLGTGAPVPVDAVTASASGLDPHISIANARIQAARVAQARGVPVDTVLKLVGQNTSSPQFGLLGDPRVNVLELNLALDAVAPVRPAAQ